MDLNDFFGPSPGNLRPNHPDFWRLSSIVLKYDGRMDEARTQEEKEAVWTNNVQRWVDEDSLNYMAMQRAMRALGVQTQGELRQHADTIIRMNVLYQEAFQFGAEFATEPHVKGTDIDELSETGLRLLLSAYQQHVLKAHEAGEKPLTVAEFYKTIYPEEG